jgi:MurNAc alpha-1-phosphate uridylyltransferase
MIMTHGMVLAAGLGTRMRPLTLTTPKPLVAVAGKTLLDWALDNLGHAGVGQVVVNVHHLAGLIEAHVQDRVLPLVTCVTEDPVLETGGGIQNALKFLGEDPFYVLNSDGLWIDDDVHNPVLKHMAALWDDRTMDALLLLHDPQAAFGYSGPGDFGIEPDGRLKRRVDSDAPAQVFTGVQILHPRLFEGAPGGAYSLNVLYDKALGAGRLFGLTHKGEWHHVGTEGALAISDAHIRDRKEGA